MKKTCEAVLRLYQERYFDPSVRHFHEKLREPRSQFLARMLYDHVGEVRWRPHPLFVSGLTETALFIVHGGMSDRSSSDAQHAVFGEGFA